MKRTKGHVIPRSLYPDSLPKAKRIIVPECTDCKTLWEDAEPHFRNIMVAIWDPDRIVEDNRFAALQRSLLKCDGPRRHKKLAELFVSVVTPNGPREKIFPAKDTGFNLILRRIIRGLCHHHGLGTAIADNRVACDVPRLPFSEVLQSEFTWHEIARDFYRYGYANPGDDNFHSFWLIRFSKHIEFSGAIAASRSGFARS